MIDDYISIIDKKIKDIQDEEKEIIIKAAEIIYNSINDYEGIVHVFGTGHSNLLAQDLIYRAGGLIPINVISNPGLTLEHNPFKAAQMEGISGISRILLTGMDLRKSDIVIVISTSGCNTVPLELAQIALEKGAYLIGITSRRYCEYLKIKRNLKYSLFDMANLSIDNKVEVGDCCLEAHGEKFGTMSTILVSLILNSIIVEVLNYFVINKQEIPIYMSNNLSDDGRQRNKNLLEKYGHRLPFKI